MEKWEEADIGSVPDDPSIGRHSVTVRAAPNQLDIIDRVVRASMCERAVPIKNVKAAQDDDEDSGDDEVAAAPKQQDDQDGWETADIGEVPESKAE